ncbi:MAG: hypothetical protein ACK417_05725 [Bacteroidia bacterium]
MKLYLVTALLSLLSGSLFAQAFEGWLFYEQKWQGKATEVIIGMASDKAHIHRKEAVALHYVLQAGGELTAWGEGEYQPSQSRVQPVVLPEFKKLSGHKIISGLKAKELSYTLSDGSVLSGWYTTELDVAYNQFIAPVQGEYWGVLPENGTLLSWKVVSAKGNLLLEGKLTHHQKEQLPAESFSFR